MTTNPVTGTSLIRRMRAAFSSPSPHGTRPTPLMRRIEAFAPSPEPPLRSRCVVRGSSFYSVAEHGGETGPPLPGSATLAESRRA